MPQNNSVKFGSISGPNSAGVIQIQHFGGALTSYLRAAPIVPSADTSEISAYRDGQVAAQQVTTQQWRLALTLEYDGSNIPPPGSTFDYAINGTTRSFVLMREVAPSFATQPGEKTTLEFEMVENRFDETVTVTNA